MTLTHLRLASANIVTTTVASFAVAFAIALPVYAQNAAVVNGKAIPSAKLDEIVNEVKKQGQPDTKELRDQIRESLIIKEIFVQEATKQKLLDRTEVKLALEDARSRIIIQALAAEYLKKNPVTDADVKAEYETAKSRAKGSEFKAHHILVDGEEDAKSIITKLKAGAKFEDLAKQSKDPGSASNGGELDWARADSYVPEFSAALQKLKKGETTDTPVKTNYGWHVIRLDDLREAQFPPFEQVKKEAGESAQQRKLAEYQQQLRAAAKVQ
jgi:peptidyl-prolyl cis-trans isomerase C